MMYKYSNPQILLLGLYPTEVLPRAKNTYIKNVQRSTYLE